MALQLYVVAYGFVLLSRHFPTVLQGRGFIAIFVSMAFSASSKQLTSTVCPFKINVNDLCVAIACVGDLNHRYRLQLLR